MTLNDAKTLIADLARPFSIIATSAGAAATPVIVVVRIAPDRLDLFAAGALVGAVYAGLGALYWGKSWEVNKTSGHAADVEKVRAAANPPPATALAPAPAEAEPDPPPADAGELPPGQRIQL